MSKIRWISYTQRNIPGNQSLQLDFLASLSQAKEVFREFCDGVGSDDCSMLLYFVAADEKDAMVSVAKEFENIGCPFDYPAKVVERGPRGGIRFVRC